MIFGNPVKGTIAGYNKPSPGTQFGVTLYFGCTPLVKAEPKLGNCDHFHRAIDLANGRAFDPVYAAAAGKVRFAGWLTMGGIAILVDHGAGWWTEYGHVINLKVAPGAQVKKGDKIAEVGSTGATAPHLHWGVKRNVTIPAGASPGVVAGQFYNDDNDTQHWTDGWDYLAQNQPLPKTVTLRNLDEIRVRNSATTAAKAYAETRQGRLIRLSDDKDIGGLTPYRYGGMENNGGSWKVTVDGKIVIGNDWIKLLVGGRYRFVAEALATVK